MKSVDGGCSPSGADQDADRFKAPVSHAGFESAIQNLHALYCFMHLIEDLLSQIYQEWCSEGPSAFNVSINVDSSSVLINQRLIHLSRTIRQNA